MLPTSQPLISTLSTPARADFSGLWIPLVTPFRGGNVDLAALQRLTGHLKSTGIAGFVVCGSTGEAAALDEDEQLAVLDTVLASAGGLPVMMGVGGDNQARAVRFAGLLNQRPLAALLVAPPAYIRPSQAGLLQWFGAIADASRAPIVVYDIPYRTGVALALETLLTLAADARFQGIKDCGGDTLKTQALIADGRLQVLAGEDAQIFSTVALGGRGAIAASAHVRTESFVAVLQALAEARLEAARQAWQPLLPLIETLFAEPNPAPVKALLGQQGWMSQELRSPMTPASASLAQRLAAWA